MLISIVIPIYNGEKYIERCFKSVINQKYLKWEIIAVDDGSCDGSLKLMKEYANHDSRIKILHQNNKGAGEARNCGIKNANGEYIVFLDVDDEIEPTYLMELSKKNADIVFIDVERVDIDTGRIVSENMSHLKVCSIDDIIRSQMTGKVLWGGVRKAVRRELLIKADIRFSSHKVGEEAIYSFLILKEAKTIDFIDSTVYRYFVHNDSLSHTDMDDPWGSVAQNLIEVTKKMGVYELYANTLNAFLITAAIVSLDKMANKYNYGKYMYEAKKIIANTRNKIDDNFPIDYKHMATKAKMVYPFFKRNMISVIYFISRGRKLLK